VPGRAERRADADAAKQKGERLVGRVNGAFQLMSFGMLPLGATVGGALGRTLGLGLRCVPAAWGCWR
jgi:hypothetical protein